MAVFPTGAQARERAQGNNTLVQQISYYGNSSA